MVPTVRVSYRRRGERVKTLIKGLAELTGIGEVFVRGANNVEKVRDLKMRGHDPMSVPRKIGYEARRIMARAILSSDPRRVRNAVKRAAQHIRDALKERITTGMLGENAPKYREAKGRMALKGQATSAYGVPPPYGVLKGHMVRAIQMRIRDGSRK